MTLTREQTVNAVDFFESDFINRQISEYWLSFVMQIVYYIVLLVCGILSNLKPTWNSILGSLGFSALGVKGNFNEAQKIWQKYQKDRRLLKHNISIIRLMLILAGDDPELLKEIVDLIRRRALGD